MNLALLFFSESIEDDLFDIARTSFAHFNENIDLIGIGNGYDRIGDLRLEIPFFEVIFLEFIKRLIEKASLLSLQNENEGTFKMLGRKKKEISQTIVLQLFIIMSDVITVFALVKGFHVIMPFPIIAFGLLLSLIIGALPISPGSLIIYESAMTYFFTKLGAPVHAALIITLLYRFLTFWLPIPIGLLVYRSVQKRKKVSLT